MLAFALRRLLSALPTLFVLMTLAFFMMRAAPGGPFDRKRSLPPQLEAALRSEYQLDAPLWKQNLHYVEALQPGDLGPSFQVEDSPGTEMVAAGLRSNRRGAGRGRGWTY